MATIREEAAGRICGMGAALCQGSHAALYGLADPFPLSSLPRISSFPRSHDEDQKAHTEFDLTPYQQTAAVQDGEQPTPPKLTPYALCQSHGTLSIWEGMPFEVPPISSDPKDEL